MEDLNDIGYLFIGIKSCLWSTRSVKADIDLLREQDLSEDRELSSVLKLGYDLEKDADRALSAANTLGAINTAKECPKKCGPQVSQQAQDTQNHNSSRSNRVEG